MKHTLPLALLLLTGCSAFGPRLYSPVIPQADGTYVTGPTAENKDKAITRATLNAERYCGHRDKSYVMVEMKAFYQGTLIDDEDAHRKAEAYSLGIYRDRNAYRTEMVFRCTD